MGNENRGNILGKKVATMTTKRSRVHRSLAISITGAMCTVAGDIVEAHANLIPIQAHLNIICQRLTVRIATLPKEHPIHAPFRIESMKMV